MEPRYPSHPDGSADQAAQPEQLLRPQAFSKVPLPGRDPLLLEGLRQLTRRCGPLSEVTTARIQS